MQVLLSMCASRARPLSEIVLQGRLWLASGINMLGRATIGRRFQKKYTDIGSPREVLTSSRLSPGRVHSVEHPQAHHFATSKCKI